MRLNIDDKGDWEKNVSALKDEALNKIWSSG